MILELDFLLGIRFMNNSVELSKRQQQVVELLLQGKSNRQIGSKLGISESTVEFHLRNIYGKLQVNSRTEAILKLGQSTGAMQAELREPLVAQLTANNHNDGKFNQESKMKNRQLYYVLAGLFFGAVYWFYRGNVSQYFGGIDLSQKADREIWWYLSMILVVSYGVWLMPTVIPAMIEYHNSRRLDLSTLVAILTWISAVFGYFASWFAVLALFAFKYSVAHRHEDTTAFWQNWMSILRLTFLPDLVLGIFLSVIIGGVSGLVTTWLYSFWLKKTSLIPES
jgi:DNA-binding CsgD family transcriptional regulator